MKFQLFLYGPQWMVSGEHLDLPIAAENQQVCWFRSPRNGRDQIERRNVTPMEVFEKDDQRCLCGQRRERLCHLAQHPLRRQLMRLALDQRALFGIQQRRQLCQPSGSQPMQDRKQLPALRPSAKLSQRLQHRHLGLACPVLFDALPTRDVHALAPQRIDEGIDESGLADPRLPRNKDNAALAVQHAREPVMQQFQLTLATDGRR